MSWLAPPLCDICRGSGSLVLVDYSRARTGVGSIRPIRRMCAGCNGTGRRKWFMSVADLVRRFDRAWGRLWPFTGDRSRAISGAPRATAGQTAGG